MIFLVPCILYRMVDFFLIFFFYRFWFWRELCLETDDYFLYTLRFVFLYKAKVILRVVVCFKCNLCDKRFSPVSKGFKVTELKYLIINCIFFSIDYVKGCFLDSLQYSGLVFGNSFTPLRNC